MRFISHRPLLKPNTVRVLFILNLDTFVFVFSCFTLAEAASFNKDSESCV